ncbi:hypothetical protein QFC19_009031 [Naganishia cerealis]|uniref:Uncharacterized protein n=1 Tax=Naganishia cerealis TaxID=610337 RepID=A0ACC2UY31_9TREE|nr:hypothetical protein QFC19_009031 [Naganishia cerealis]
MAGAYKYIAELYKKKQSDVMLFLARVRCWEYRQLAVIHRASRPSRPDKARRLGYKAKQGYVVYRIRVRRGNRKKPVPKGATYGKPVRQGVNHLKFQRGLRATAEERVGRRCGNLRVLNSYWINQDGVYKYYEVICVDPSHKAIRRDARINWIANPVHKHREARGLTAEGKKNRGTGKGHKHNHNYATWKRHNTDGRERDDRIEMAVPAPGNHSAFAGLDDFVTKVIPNVTMDKLRQVIDVLNLQHRSTVGGQIKKAGKKAELVASVQDAVRAFRRQGNAEGYRKLKVSWEGIINPWSARPAPTFAKTAPTPGTYAPGTYSSYLGGAGGYGYGYGGIPGQHSHSPAGPSSSSSSSYPIMNRPGAPATTFPLVKWKTTPGWKAIKALSDTYLLPAIEDGHNSERRNKMVPLILTQPDIDAVNALTAPGQPKREIRLFCTSSDYYPTAIAAGDSVPLEFPYNSEITVDNKVVHFRKGLKGRANTAAPVPLDSSSHPVRKSHLAQTNVSVTHVGPSLNKKTKEAKRLIQRSPPLIAARFAEILLPNMSYRSHAIRRYAKQDHKRQEESKSGNFGGNSEAQKYLLKIPYFQSILAVCPDSVDEVIIEPDGEWHTEDGKYGSSGWTEVQKTSTAASSSKATSLKASTPLDEKPQIFGYDFGARSDATPPHENDRGGASLPRMQEVVSLDDSDDDEQPIRRPAARTIYTAPSSESRAREEANSVDRLLEMYATSADSTGQSSEGVPPATTFTGGAGVGGAQSLTATLSEPVIDLTSTDDEQEDENGYGPPALPAWAADLPALARSDKRERSMSSLMEADDRYVLRRRLVDGVYRDSSLPPRTISTPTAEPIPSPGVARANTGLKVRLTLPPRPRIDPLPSWMNTAPPSRYEADQQNGSRDDGANWLNAVPSRSTSSAGTMSPVLTAPSPVSAVSRPAVGEVSGLPKG